MSDNRRIWIIPFVATIFAMMTMQMSSLGFSPLLLDIKAEFQLSKSQIGLFTGMYGLVAIVMSIPGGLLAKRFGEKRALTAGLLVMAMGILSVSFAANFPTVLASRAIWILGYRVAFVCVMTAIAFTAPPSFKGSAMGILGTMASLATVIGAPFGNEISESLGWRNGFRAYSLMALVGATVFFLLYRRISDQPTTTTRHGPTTLDVSARRGPDSPFRDPLVWSLILLGTINMGGFSTTFFLPSTMETIYELPKALAKEKATQIISSSYIFAIFANLSFGYLCDRFNRWNMMLVLAMVLFLACITLMIQNMTVLWISAALLIGLGLSATNQLYALASELSAGKNLATVMGVASLGGGVFGFFGPQMAGILVDLTGGFRAVWIFFACGVAVSFIELLVLKRSVEARWNSENVEGG